MRVPNLSLIKNFTFKIFKFGLYFENKISDTLHYNLQFFFFLWILLWSNLYKKFLVWVMSKSIYFSLNVKFCIFWTLCIFSPTPKTHVHLSCFQSSGLSVFLVVSFLFFSLFFFVIRFRNLSSHSVGYTSLSTCSLEELTLHLIVSVSL